MRVRPHNRFTVVCDVTVPHVTDASRVLQHLQRQKIGTKRVLVTLTQQGGDDVTAEDYSSLKLAFFFNALFLEISPIVLVYKLLYIFPSTTFTSLCFPSSRRDCFSILKDCGQWGMQLFKFLTLYEKR